MKRKMKRTVQLKKGKRLKILIYRIGQLGDTIIALPSLWAIRRAFPEANLTYLRSEQPGSGHVPAELILPREGLIDDWLTYTLDGPGGLWGMFRLWRTIRARHFDAVVYLSPRVRSRRSILRDLVFFRTAGIRRFIAHKGIVPLPPRVPGQPLPAVVNEADHLLERLALSQIPIPPKSQRELDFALTSQEKQVAEDWLRAHVPGFPAEVSLLGLGPGSKWPSKLWFEERYEELGKRLIAEYSLFPVVVGGPSEAPLAQRLIKQWGRGVCVGGELSLRQTAAVLAHCRLFVGNDSGAMHLAAAVHTPCVGIFAAQDWPGRWYPYGSGHVVLRRPVSCEGCLLSECTTEGMRCLKEISVDDALQACRSILHSQGS